MLFGIHTQLVAESVVPYPLHVIPVHDDSMLDGVCEGEDATPGLRLISNVMAFPELISASTKGKGSMHQRKPRSQTLSPTKKSSYMLNKK